MTQTKTAAEMYAGLKQDRFEAFLEQSFSDEALKGVDLYEVKCPSGMVFKCRKIDKAYAQNAGQMPLALSSQLVASRGKTPPTAEDSAKAFNAMSDIEQRAAIQASAQMIRYVAVEPRLVMGDVDDQANAISVEVLTIEDFNVLCTWAGGGDAAAGLKTFRRKRR